MKIREVLTEMQKIFYLREKKRFFKNMCYSKNCYQLREIKYGEIHKWRDLINEDQIKNMERVL